MAAVGVVDGMGLPVSTARVLASGVAGSMAAGGSGLPYALFSRLA